MSRQSSMLWSWELFREPSRLAGFQAGFQVGQLAVKQPVFDVGSEAGAQAVFEVLNWLPGLQVDFQVSIEAVVSLG